MASDLKRWKVGDTAYALDYREHVTIVAVERRPNATREFKGTFTVRRSNGATTSNYPGYLLTEGRA